ncbi:MAG TPA: cytochrome c [Methylophilaceae bacterium]|nr:cytochrome c [Methylophilaceae bacterium]
MSEQDMEKHDQSDRTSSQPLSDPVESEISTLDIHQALMREASDPDEAFDPGPLWFWVLVVGAIVVGSFYMGKYMGAFSTQTHIGYLKPGLPAAAETAGQTTEKAKVSGATIYTSKCSVCHQTTGLGVPGAFPPLVNSEYVLGDPSVPIRIVLHGMQGPIEVQGGKYNGAMPAWAGQLTDDEIAAVVSYIRSELGGNNADPVDAEFVAKLRQDTGDKTTPYTAEELAGGQQ